MSEQTETPMGDSDENDENGDASDQAGNNPPDPFDVETPSGTILIRDRLPYQRNDVEVFLARIRADYTTIHEVLTLDGLQRAPTMRELRDAIIDEAVRRLLHTVTSFYEQQQK